jgi:hypothetical protein
MNLTPEQLAAARRTLAQAQADPVFVAMKLLIGHEYAKVRDELIDAPVESFARLQGSAQAHKKLLKYLMSPSS